MIAIGVFVEVDDGEKREPSAGIRRRCRDIAAEFEESSLIDACCLELRATSERDGWVDLIFAVARGGSVEGFGWVDIVLAGGGLRGLIEGLDCVRGGAGRHGGTEQCLGDWRSAFGVRGGRRCEPNRLACEAGGSARRGGRCGAH